MAAMAFPGAVNILIPRLTCFSLITRFIEPLSDDAAIIQTLPDGIGNNPYHRRFIVRLRGVYPVCHRPPASAAAATSMRSTSASIRDCGLLSGWLYLLRASTSHVILSLPEDATASLKASCNSAGTRNSFRLDLLIGRAIILREQIITMKMMVSYFQYHITTQCMK